MEGMEVGSGLGLGLRETRKDRREIQCITVGLVEKVQWLR